jgi:23S rRNA pseudouridine1911/1915/1917 synthase
MKKKEVVINGMTAKPHTLVYAGDHISWSEQVVTISPPPLPLDILFENDEVLVINKPSGIAVHKVHEHDAQPTLCDALLAYLPSLAQVGENPLRPGLVHRLDKLVSGIMVIAKTPETFAHLKEQFKNRTVKKEYLALVYGNLPKDHDVLTFKIGRSKNSGRMSARPEQQDGKEAKTEYDVLRRFKTATLARVRIHTGRTHQIRAHFLAIDHPVVGDTLYKKRRMTRIRPLSLDRLFLHAHTLSFSLLDGTSVSFCAPLPPSLDALLLTLPSL